MGSRKVVLYNLPSDWLINDAEVPPRGILSIASYLRKNGVTVQFVDLASLKPDEWIVPEAGLYGVSSTTPQYPAAMTLIRKIRSVNPQARIAIGGPHSTVLPEEVHKTSWADWVVVGEGEEVMLKLALHDYYPGITVAPLIKHLDRLPIPAFDLLGKSYSVPKTNSFVGGSKEGYVQTARGCPFNCHFCCQGKIWRRKVRMRSVNNVIREVLYHLANGCDQIYFNDDTFVLNQKRLTEICQALHWHRGARSFIWHCLTRADSASFENLKMMYECGCRAVTFGVESGSQDMLAAMNKKLSIEQTALAVFRAKEVGLKVRCQMIVGFPGEDDDTVSDTARFIRAVPADAWGLHAFVPFPGCAVWDDPKKFGFEIPSEVDYGEFHTIGRPGEWHKIINPQEEQVRIWLSRLQNVAGEKNIYKKIGA